MRCLRFGGEPPRKKKRATPPILIAQATAGPPEECGPFERYFVFGDLVCMLVRFLPRNDLLRLRCLSPSIKGRIDGLAYWDRIYGYYPLPGRLISRKVAYPTMPFAAFHYVHYAASGCLALAELRNRMARVQRLKKTRYDSLSVSIFCMFEKQIPEIESSIKQRAKALCMRISDMIYMRNLARKQGWKVSFSEALLR